jgi:uncharacterized C2H2 Zn-finger protein
MSYKRMFVMNEDEYKEFKRFKASQVPAPPPPSTIVKCPKCSREYPNENIMAHHLKSHVDGFKCNICGKVFESKASLTSHLKKHAPQVQPSTHSVLENHVQNQQPLPSMQPHTSSVQYVKPAKPRKPHKHKSVIKFDAKTWLTLK